MKYSLFVLLLLAVNPSFAQSKKRGFVVLNNKDSLYGWIDYSTTQKSLEKIAFYRDSLSITPAKYSIADLAYFEITAYDAYIRAEVPVTVPMYRVSANSAAVEDTAISQTVWLRIVVTGDRLSLFEWKNERVHYYVKEGTGDYTEMRIQTTYDQGYERELPLYKNQLTALAIKYELSSQAISRAIDNTRYDDDDLGKIVTELNGNKNIIQYKKIRDKSKWTCFLNAGATLATLKLSGDRTYVGNLTFDHSVAPYFSLGVELSNVGINRFALRLEASYTSVRYNGKGPSYTSSNNQMFYELEQRNITPSLAVLYSLIRKKYFSLYGCIGMAYNISSYNKNVWSQTFPALKLTDFAHLKKSYIGASVKLGIRMLQKFEIGAGRQFIDDFIFQSSKYSFDHATYNMWVGYRFN